MSKHTPGPWFYVQGDEWSHSVCTREGELPDGSPSFWSVASVNKRREPAHEANARLIAAAPELLEALQHLTLVLKAAGYGTERADAAIAKATHGEQS